MFFPLPINWLLLQYTCGAFYILNKCKCMFVGIKLLCILDETHLNPLYLGKPLNEYFVNSEDPDKMQHNVHCL